MRSQSSVGKDSILRAPTRTPGDRAEGLSHEGVMEGPEGRAPGLAGRQIVKSRCMPEFLNFLANIYVLLYARLASLFILKYTNWTRPHLPKWNASVIQGVRVHL